MTVDVTALVPEVIGEMFVVRCKNAAEAAVLRRRLEDEGLVESTGDVWKASDEVVTLP